jgi:hypothetical protein
MGAPLGIPGLWVAGGGAGLSNAECNKALADCGLVPDQFGEYSDVSESQSAARKKLRADARKAAGDESKHIPPCKLPSKPENANAKTCRCSLSPQAQALVTPEEFYHANSEAGHLLRDDLMRAKGGRDDPCANHPPDFTGKPPAHSGGCGYETSSALCMDHFGSSTLGGSTHHLVCGAERDFAKAQDNQIPMSQLKVGVASSAVTTVTAGRLRLNPETKSLEPQQVKQNYEGNRDKTSSAQSATAASLSQGQSTFSSRLQSGELSDSEKIAVQCIVQQWENSVGKVQSDAVAKHGPDSPEKQQALLAAYNKKNGTKHKTWDSLSDDQKKEAVEARQKELATAKAGGPNAAGKAMDPPSKDDCKEWQANWLWQNQTAGGFPPPMGRKPGVSTSTNNTAGAAEPD